MGNLKMGSWTISLRQELRKKMGLVCIWKNRRERSVQTAYRIIKTGRS